MFKKSRVAAMAAFAVVGAVAMGAPAQAEQAGSDNQNVGLLNDVNLNVLNIELCNSAINVIAIPIELLSPEKVDDCVNAPVTDINKKSGRGGGSGNQNVGALNDLNLNALNITLCNSAVNVIAIPIELLSPEAVDDCVGAPLTDVNNN